MRVRFGFDVHRLVEGRPLVLCGVKIPFDKGLLGHSDADVALHALIDALLGAAGLGDIGQHFPDTDERYRGISSLRLLEATVQRLKKASFTIVNVDLTLVAQRPKLFPFFPQMRKELSRVLSLKEDRINIKAKTTEGLGFCGREEGIAAYAVTLIENGS